MYILCIRLDLKKCCCKLSLLKEQKFQNEIIVGHLVNHNNVRRIISDGKIFSSVKNITGSPQFFHNMLLDVFTKNRQFGVYTFFLTCSAAKFHWTEINQVVARQYGKRLHEEQVHAMDWSTNVNYSKRNPVTVARQIDYVFKQLRCGKVILSGMHPIGQILYRREFISRGTEHMHALIHIVDAPKFNEKEDSEVVEFIHKCITCTLHDETVYLKMSNLVKRV